MSSPVILGCHFDNSQVWVIKKIEITQYLKEVLPESHTILSSKSADHVAFLYIPRTLWTAVVTSLSRSVHVYTERMILS